MRHDLTLLGLKDSMNQLRIAELVQAATTARRAGKPDLASRHWRSLLAIAPAHPAALNALGAEALARGDLPTALTRFRLAAEADPTSPDLWLNLARVQHLVGDDIGQRDSLERSIALAPRALVPNIRLAELLERLGQSTAAAERWTAVIAIASQLDVVPPDVRSIIAHAQSLLAEQARVLGEDVDRALALLRDERSAQCCRRVDAAIDYTLGRRSIYLNQCSGLHVPFLPADEFFDSAAFPFFGLLANSTDAIVAELGTALASSAGVPPGFAPYIDLPTGIDVEQWRRLDKSSDWSALHFWRDGVRDDAVCRHFPRTAAMLDALPLARLPRRMPTIFFSALQPGTHIPPHTGVTNARAIVHLPLIVPEGCRFRVGGETRVWRVGEPFAFDDTIEHEAWNDGDALRVVLIMDAWNPYLTPDEQKLITAFYAATELSAIAPSTAERMRLG